MYFFFFSNNVRSYDSRSDLMIYNSTYLLWFYIKSRFWQPCMKYINFFLKKKKIHYFFYIYKKKMYNFKFTFQLSSTNWYLFNNYKIIQISILLIKIHCTYKKVYSLPFENIIRTNTQVSLQHNINIPKYLKKKNYKCPIR